MRKPAPSPSVYFPLLKLLLMVAFAGCNTRTRRRPATASRLFTRVGATGTLTWNVALVPAVIAKVSRTVSFLFPNSNRRCHEVTALYEIIPAGRQGWLGDSRYQPAAAAVTTHGQEYAYVNIRYKPVGKSASTLLSVPVPVGSRPLAQSSTDMRFATAVASYGQQLRGGRHTGNFGWKDTLALAKGAQGQDPFGLRAEFVELVETAASLSSRQPDGSAPPPDLRPQPLPRPVPVKPIPIPRPVLPMPPQPY